MSAVLEIQKALIAALRADLTLAAFLAVHETEAATPAVYDYVPQPVRGEDASRFPYVVVGEHTETDFDTDDSVGTETTITLHTFTRSGGNKRAREIQGRIKALLHRNTALVIAGQLVVDCLLEYAEVIPDPDGVTRHGVSRFRFITQGE
jgi:hypothetical protein